MARLQHNEPFGWDVVEAYLERKGGVFQRQTGSHRHYKMPNGKMAGSGIHGTVTTALMRKNAEALDMSYKDMRADMGWPITSSGRSSFKPKAKSVPDRHMVTKADVLAELDRLVGELGDVRGLLANGQRDASLYLRTYSELRRLRDQLGRLQAAAGGRAA